MILSSTTTASDGFTPIALAARRNISGSGFPRSTSSPYTTASDEKIKLKIDHTYRVAGLCQRIAESLGLSEPDVDIAWLLGMLHDIGRFEQIRRFPLGMERRREG